MEPGGIFAVTIQDYPHTQILFELSCQLHSCFSHLTNAKLRMPFVAAEVHLQKLKIFDALQHNLRHSTLQDAGVVGRQDIATLRYNIAQAAPS
jgi:hypothetical protein